MDPLMLSTSVVGILMPYLVKGGEAIAKIATDAAIEKAGELYQLIKERFSTDPYAQETLKRSAEDPNSESRKAALTGVLEEKIKADPSFATDLEGFLALARELGSDQISQTVRISGNARTGNVNVVGKVDGNLDISQKPK